MTEKLSTSARTALVAMLRALSAMQHDDMTIGAEAADVIAADGAWIAELERRLADAKRDSERIDWMESQGFGAGLIHDDEGHWIWADEGGFQGLRSTAPDDPWQTVLFVEDHSKFRERIRDAIDVGRANREKRSSRDG